MRRDHVSRRRHRLSRAFVAWTVLVASSGIGGEPAEAQAPSPAAEGGAGASEKVVEPAAPATTRSDAAVVEAPKAAGSPPAAGPASAPAPSDAAADAPPGAAKEDAEAPGGFGGLSFASEDEPIVVEADRMEFDYEQNRLVYKGAVHVVQGDLELTSRSLHVTFARTGELERAQLEKVVALGDVVITQGERRASGHRAVFNQINRQIVLIGDPVLRDGPNEVQGDRLTVYLDEGRSVVESSPKKRVSAVLFPGAGDDDGAEESTVPEGFPRDGEEEP